jgi:hypothetical protein
VLVALAAAAAPLQSREIDAMGAALAVLRDASVSEETIAALGALGVLATAASVEWPISPAGYELAPPNH